MVCPTRRRSLGGNEEECARRSRKRGRKLVTSSHIGGKRRHRNPELRTKTFTTVTVRLSDDDLRMKETKRATAPPRARAVIVRIDFFLRSVSAFPPRQTCNCFTVAELHFCCNRKPSAGTRQDQLLTLIHTALATKFQFCHCEVWPRLSPALPYLAALPVKVYPGVGVRLQVAVLQHVPHQAEGEPVRKHRLQRTKGDVLG